MVREMVMVVARFYDIDVDPCTKYVVRVQASEDYQGRRDDFKAISLEVHHKVDYTPRFMSKPSVKVRRLSFNPPAPPGAEDPEAWWPGEGEE